MSQRKEKYVRRLQRLELAQDRCGAQLAEAEQLMQKSIASARRSEESIKEVAADMKDMVKKHAGKMRETERTVRTAAGEMRNIVERNGRRMKDNLADTLYQAEEIAGCVKIALFAMGVTLLATAVTVITVIAA